jgi:hypothetical protein
MTEEHCEKCGVRPVEYDHPGRWCAVCWAWWWADGVVGKDASPKARRRAYREVRQQQKMRKKQDRSQRRRLLLCAAPAGDPTFFYCENCKERHWVPDQLVQLPDAGARLAKINLLLDAEDISTVDYYYWRHVIVALAMNQSTGGGGG